MKQYSTTCKLPLVGARFVIMFVLITLSTIIVTLNMSGNWKDFESWLLSSVRKSNNKDDGAGGGSSYKSKERVLIRLNRKSWLSQFGIDHGKVLNQSKCFQKYPSNNNNNTIEFEDKRDCLIVIDGVDIPEEEKVKYGAYVWIDHFNDFNNKQAINTSNSINDIKRVFFSMESRYNKRNIYSHEMFNRFFDYTMSYEWNSTIPATYFYYKQIDNEIKNPLVSTTRKINTNINNNRTTDAQVVYIQSNCNEHTVSTNRDSYISELMKYIKVDSFGRCLNNRNATELYPECKGDKKCILSNYKFTLAFENTANIDYVTEKFYDPLLVGSVPVYLGAPNIKQFIPHPKSFINVMEKRDPQELAQYLIELLNNDQLYFEYQLEWRNQPYQDSYYTALGYGLGSSFCRLCNKLLLELENY